MLINSSIFTIFTLTSQTFNLMEQISLEFCQAKIGIPCLISRLFLVRIGMLWQIPLVLMITVQRRDVVGYIFKQALLTLVSGDSLLKKGPPLSPWQESFPPSGRPAQIIESATAYLAESLLFGSAITCRSYPLAP